MVIITILILLMSVVIHEVAHAYMAYLLGDRTAKDLGRITLNPLKHIDPVMSIIFPAVLYFLGAPVIGAAKPVPVNFASLRYISLGQFLVAFVGPLSNILIAIFLLILTIPISQTNLVGPSAVMFTVQALMTGVVMNVALALFNSMPVPPLDGSKMLSSLFPPKLRATYHNPAIEGIGGIVVIILLMEVPLISDNFISLIQSIAQYLHLGVLYVYMKLYMLF